MDLSFKTKTNKNGGANCVHIDLTKKTVEKTTRMRWDKYTTVKANSDLDNIVYQFEVAGFKSIS